MKINSTKLADYCRKNNIRWIALFGSVLRGEPDSDSDIDLLIEFNEPVGLFDFCRIESEISEKFFSGQKVDLVTRRALSRYFRDEVLNNCETLYGKAG